MKKPASIEKKFLARSKADPFTKGNNALRVCVAPILAGMADEGWKTTIGRSIAEMLEKDSPEQLAKVFAEIVKMKKRIESEHIERSTFATAAFFRFENEHGKKPSKLELKRFIIENPKVYPGFPADEADSEWTRIWKNADMNHAAWFPLA